MGKKAKKGGLIGDFSDEEQEEVVVEEEVPKKGKKVKEESDDEKQPAKKETGKKKQTSKAKDVEEEEKPSKPAGKKKKDIDEDEEESKPAKKTKAKKAAKSTKPESDEELDDDEPKTKTPKKSKKKKAGEWQDYEGDEGEEEAKTSKKSTKGADEEKGKAKKQTKKPSVEDEEDEAEAPKKGKGKSKKDNKTKQEEEDSEDDEETPKGKQAPKAEPAPAASKKKGKKKAAENYWDQEYEKDAEAAAAPAAVPAKVEAEDEDEKKDKKKKKKKAAAKSKGEDGEVPATETSTEPAVKKDSTPAKSAKQPEKPKDAKAAAKDKKMAKTLELLRKQREEQERLDKEAEEIRKKEEEEERILLEEERRIQEEERKRKMEKKKLKPKQPTISAAAQVQNAKNAAFLQSLKEKGALPKDAEAPPKVEKVRSKVYSTKRKTTKKTETEETPAVAETTPTVETPSQSEPQPAKEEEKEEDDWENWEDHVEEVIKKIEVTKLEEEKQKEPEPVPVVAQPAPPAPVVAQPAKKTEDSKSKSANKKDKKGGNKKEKKDTKESTEEDKVDIPDSERELRSPICCILGHVDTGKTSLLDKIRATDVQGGEAGGITQQIGATYFPMSAIHEKTQSLSEKFNLQVKVPGLLVIDTPGHESFTNLRSRGSGLCDIAILVVDIMHALEPQTIESINLLRMRKTPFVVALNKVDRIYGWRSKPFNSFRESLKIQDKSAALEFETRTRETINAFAEHSLNAVLYYKNTDFRKYVSLVPTSAHTGEGIPDLLMLLVQLTQKMMPERLFFSEQVQCTVLEVKVVEGLGTTLDVILVNGVLREGDTIVLCGLNGPIVTTIRAVLAPQPLRELRVKGAYEKLKEIKAAMGTKIVAQDLEKAVAGSALFVAKNEEEIEDFKEEVQSDFDSILNSVDSSSRGVCVQASTLGSLEALLTFLKASKIPVSGVSIGPIHKRDVIRASVMLEHNAEFAVILAFDVKVEKDAQAMADSVGVQIFTADIIYHLFDRFTAYMAGLKQKKREAAGDKVVWPCVARIKSDCIFNKKAPIVVGMEVVSGTMRLGTPLCIPGKGFVDIGVVTGIEKNHKQQQEAKKGDEVAVKIESSPENAKEYGKHFDHQFEVCSRISRESIDLLVSLWGEELSQSDRALILKLKKEFKIQ